MSPSARIAGKGIYDIPISEYVADPCVEPSLSASIAKVLVDPKKTPAHAKLKHPRFTVQPVREFNAVPNFGSAVHALTFGGPKVVPLAFKDWKKEKAREERDAVLAAGDVPLLEKDVSRARACAEVARKSILTLSPAWKFEQTLVWKSAGMLHRCRPDAHCMLRLIVDLKVTQTAPADANRQFFNQGEDMQAAFVEAGCNELDPDGTGRRKFFYLYVEDDAPFDARLLPVSEATLTLARKSRIAATNIWRQCVTSGEWPTGKLMLPPSDRPGYLEAQQLTREIENPELYEEAA